jgi:hypothetical protein
LVLALVLFETMDIQCLNARLTVSVSAQHPLITLKLYQYSCYYSWQ